MEQKKKVRLSDIANKLREERIQYFQLNNKSKFEYGLSNVTLGATESFLRRMSGKYLIRENGTYKKIDNAVTREAEKTIDNGLEMAMNSLCDEIEKYAKKQYKFNNWAIKLVLALHFLPRFPLHQTLSGPRISWSVLRRQFHLLRVYWWQSCLLCETLQHQDLV